MSKLYLIFPFFYINNALVKNKTDITNETNGKCQRRKKQTKTFDYRLI